MENKLSDEQVERAAEAAYNADEYYAKWITAKRALRNEWIVRVRAAAPYLQFPIEEPSKEEINQLYNDYYDNPLTRVGMGGALRNFVSRRNAALLPKPDQRREAICKVVLQDGRQLSGVEADAVLAALEEVEEVQK